MALPGGKTLSLPVRDGKIDVEVSQPGVLIPKGFPASGLPSKPSDYPKLGTGHEAMPNSGSVLGATYDTANNPTHWSTWRWAGAVSSPAVRALVVYDRTAANESPAVADWVYAWQNYVRQRLANLGLSNDRNPQITYIRDSGAQGQCPARGGWLYNNYSFTTICTSWDMTANCNPGNLGCSWFASEGQAHNGTNYQPSQWIKAGQYPYTTIRNVVHHELFHQMGMPHNLSQPCSIMDPSVNTCDGGYFDKNLTADDDQFLKNKYAHNPD